MREAPRSVRSGGIVIVEGTGFLPGVDEDGNLDVLGTSAAGGPCHMDRQAVTGSEVSLQCHATVENLSGCTQEYPAISCAVQIPDGFIVVVDEAHLTVSASGEARLVCTYPRDS